MEWIVPAMALLVLAPLIAEFLLGDFSVGRSGFFRCSAPRHDAPHG